MTLAAATVFIALAATLPSPVDHTLSPERAEPLPRPASNTECPLFAAIAPQKSGLSQANPYSDPAIWSHRFAEFTNGALGSGVAVGDYDRDGLPDLYIVNKFSPNRLYRQTSALAFEDVTERAGVAGATTWSAGATFADIDGDGWVDLFVCQTDGPPLYYRNLANGAFAEQAAAAGIDAPFGSVHGAFEDYDRDGHLDLFLVTNIGDFANAPAGEPDRLFRANGDGTFTDVTAAAGIVSAPDRGHAAIWWDCDSDGWADLYVANDFDAPDHLYRNNRDGTFTDIASSALPHTPWFSMGADFADINNDSLLDFFATDMAGSTHHRRQTFALGNGDAAASMARLSPPQHALNALYLNTGNRSFVELSQLAGIARTDWTWSPLFGDFDNDGWQDLFITNGMIRDLSHADLIKRLNQTASRPHAIAHVRNSPIRNENNWAFRNNTRLGFDNVTAQWGLDHEGVSFGAAAADLDRDGDLDLIYNNLDAPPSLLRNDSAANRVVVLLRQPGPNPHAIGATVVATTSAGSQTRRLTLAHGALSSTLPEALFGLGTDSKIEQLEIRWPDGRADSATNLAANYRYTFRRPAANAPAANPTPCLSQAPTFTDVTSEIGLSHRHESETFDETAAQPLLPMRRQTLDAGLAFGDANGDGLVDLYLAGGYQRPGKLFLLQKNGVFAPSATQPTHQDIQAPSREIAPLWLDADRGGTIDLLLTTGGVEHANSPPPPEPSHLLDATSTGAPILAPDSAAVAAADFDQDGDLDLFLGGSTLPGRYPLFHKSVILENRGGHFAPLPSSRAPAIDSLAHATSALWSDADGDGWLDLIVAEEWGAVRLFLNRSGTAFEEITETAGFAGHTGLWRSVQAGDIDRDGDTDYLVGNLGLNTPYLASPQAPARLYYGDFDDSGTSHILEAYYEDGRLLPRRSLAELGKAMPLIQGLYASTTEFAQAALEDIVFLDQALALEATQLAHGVWINNGKAQFHFRPLPPLAQSAPVFGAAIQDFDGDSLPDLLLAQNVHGVPPQAPRFRGTNGLLLRGRGDGHFEPLAPNESGVWIEGEGRGLATADWNHDGWPDAVFTQSNGPLTALQNAARKPGANSFTVVLQGPPGNPHCIGATITLSYADGSRLRSQIQAGGGFLSQDAPQAFFGWQDANPPTVIELVWPDGQRETHPWRAAARISFAHP